MESELQAAPAALEEAECVLACRARALLVGGVDLAALPARDRRFLLLGERRHEPCKQLEAVVAEDVEPFRVEASAGGVTALIRSRREVLIPVLP